MQNALAYFGGVPALVVCDNCKQAVIVNRDWIAPEPNMDYAAWAEYNRTVNLPAKVKKSKYRSSAENAVGIPKKGFFHRSPVLLAVIVLDDFLVSLVILDAVRVVEQHGIKYTPRVEAMRANLKKCDRLCQELSAENAALEQKLNAASRGSIRKSPEIQRKRSEPDELRRTVEVLPPEILQAAKRAAVHKGQER